MDIKHQIYELFIKNRRLRFSDIEKTLGIRSNKLSYHLTAMVKEGLLTKDEDDYILTPQGETKIPFFSQFTSQEQGMLPAVLIAIVKGKNILLLKRNKRPYQGYWGMPAATLTLHESLPSCVEREAKEETGIDCAYSHTATILHERVKEAGHYKHAFVLFLVVVKPKTTTLKESDEGKLEWFPLKTIQPSRIIPSDYHLVKKYLGKKTNIISIEMEEKEGRLISFKQEKI